MISIQPGHTIDQVLEHLTEAANDAANLRSRTPINDDAYLSWAANQLRTLGSCLSEFDLDRLLLTRYFWGMLQGSPAEGPNPGRARLIDLELERREKALRTACAELKRLKDEWHAPWDTMALLDTTVLLRDGTSIANIDWRTRLDQKSTSDVILWIPLVVINELDRLKKDRGLMRIGKKEIHRRTLARKALRAIGESIENPSSPWILTPPLDSQQPKVEVRLLMEDRAHNRLERVDDEVVSRAVDLQPFASRVVVVTYDAGMAYAARYLEVDAVLVPDEEDLEDFTEAD